MTDGKPQVSIVIVNWNSRELLRKCIQSIRDQTTCPHEIIVIDNASSDGSVEMLKSEFFGILLLANDTNRGFAAANNQGIQRATGQYTLLLNPDTVILDHAVDHMVEWIRARPDVGCAGCQVWQSATEIQKTCFEDPSPLNILLVETGLQQILPDWAPMGNPEYSGWNRGTERDVDVVSGMFMLMPEHVLRSAGLLDERFYIYAEEADLCRRIRTLGLRCVFTPIARIMHVDGGGKSTQQIRPRMHVQLQKSMLLYNKKHSSGVGFATVVLIYIVSSALRWAILGTTGRITKNSDYIRRAKLAKTALAYHILGRVPT